MKIGDPVYVKLNHSRTYTILEMGGRVNDPVAWCEDNVTHERVPIPIDHLELVPPPVAKLPRGTVQVFYDPATGENMPVNAKAFLSIDLRKHFIHEAAIKEIEKNHLYYHDTHVWRHCNSEGFWHPADSLEAAVLALDPKLGEALA